MWPNMKTRNIVTRALALGRVAVLAVQVLSVCILAYAESPQAPDPTTRWALDLFAGALFHVGSRSPELDHTLVPVIPTLTSGAVMRRKLGSGDLLVRSRFSLLGLAIMDGPETHYI